MKCCIEIEAPHYFRLGPRLVAPEFAAGKVTVATVATVAFRLYLVIIVQTLTN